MSKQFIRITSGWIPVSVLLLCTVALVAGQADANLPNAVKATPQPAPGVAIDIVLSRHMQEKLDSLAVVVDTLVSLPDELEISSDNADRRRSESDFDLLQPLRP